MMNKLSEIIIEAISSTSKDYYKYLEEKEIEITEKEKTIARMKITVEAIRANREAEEYFTGKFFSEKEKLSDMANKALDKAINSGDIELAEIALKLINTIYEKNIFEIKKNKFGER